MAKKEKEGIQKRHLIVCEGMDEKMFLIHYLNSDALSRDVRFSNDIQVMNFGGNDELNKFLLLLKNTPNFDDLKSLLIIRDAEKDPQRAIREVKGALEKAELSVPSAPHKWEGQSMKVGFLLFPTCSDEVKGGTLEDLCLSILSESQSLAMLEEIDAFLDLLRNKHQMVFSWEFKTKLHTYFSVSNKYVSLKIGEAAKVGAFDWRDGRLEPLRDFLSEVL